MNHPEFQELIQVAKAYNKVVSRTASAVKWWPVRATACVLAGLLLIGILTGPGGITGLIKTGFSSAVRTTARVGVEVADEAGKAISEARSEAQKNGAAVDH